MAEAVTKVTRRVILDLDYCIECRSCAAACFYGHGAMPAVCFGETGPVTVPIVCKQCAEPACVDACPADAMKIDDSGVVRRAINLCRGCGSCVRACPFGVLDPAMVRNKVGKCDLCADRTEAGGIPRCVSVCPTGALRFAEASEVEAEGLLVIGGRLAGRHPFKRR